MDWRKHMNSAISYIEENLDGDISYERIAQLAHSSRHHFQRMFSYIIGMPLSEYIRRRRLTKAAFDLQNGDKVIDVAMKYGYDSPTAFTRAFHAIHGLSPSAAQAPGTSLKAFPSISLQLTIKGVHQIDYRIVEKKAFRAIGIRQKINVSEGDFFIVNFSQAEQKLVDSIKSDISDDLLGLYIEEDDCESGFYYFCKESNEPVPSDMFVLEIPNYTWAVFTGVREAAASEDLFHRIYTEWLPTANYNLTSNLEIEVYSKAESDEQKYEIWLPVTKKKIQKG